MQIILFLQMRPSIYPTNQQQQQQLEDCFKWIRLVTDRLTFLNIIHCARIIINSVEKFQQIFYYIFFIINKKMCFFLRNVFANFSTKRCIHRCPFSVQNDLLLFCILLLFSFHSSWYLYRFITVGWTCLIHSFFADAFTSDVTGLQSATWFVKFIAELM